MFWKYAEKGEQEIAKGNEMNDPQVLQGLEMWLKQFGLIMGAGMTSDGGHFKQTLVIPAASNSWHRE